MITRIKFFKLIIPVIVLSTLFLYYNPSKGPRSFLAFAQHYVWDINERIGIKNNDISESIIKKHFGDDNTVLKVALNRPGIFFEHIAFNLARYPSHISDLFPFFITNDVHSYIKLVLYVLLIFILIISIIIYFKFYDRKFLNLTNLIYFIFVIPALLSTIIVYPKNNYMLLIEVLLLIFSGYMISNYLIMKKNKLINVPGIAILICIIFVIVIPSRSNVVSIHELNCTIVNLIKSINKVQENSPVTLMAVAPGISPYLEKNITLLSPKYFNIPFEEFIKKYNVNMVLLNGELLNHRNVSDNPEFNKFKRDSNFVTIDLGKCTKQLIVNKNILR